MSLSLFRNVLQSSAKSFSVLAVALAASALAAQAQVVFSPAVNVSNSPGGGPQVAVDRNGNINMVWVAADVFFSRSTDGGATFSTPQNLSSGIPAFTRLWPEIGLDPSGNINVVWTNEFQAQPGGPVIVDAYYSRSNDGGATFSAPLNLSQDGSGAASEAAPLAVDSSGNIYVVWQRNAGQILFTRSSDGGGGFSASQVVSGSLQAQLASLALDTAGNINVAFTAAIQGNSYGDIYLTRSADGGATFSTPLNATNVTSSQAAPVNYLVAVDSSGNIDILYQTGCNCSSYTFFTRSTDGGATFAAPAPVSMPWPPNVIVTNMTTDSAGDINVFGYEATIYSGNPFCDPPCGPVVYQYKGFFMRSGDGGATFSSAQLIATGYDTQSAYGMLSQMVVDPGGNIDMAIRIGTPSNGADLYLLRSTDGGRSFASTNISNTGGYMRDYAYPPTIALDSTGNINVAWDDETAGSGHNVVYSRGIVASPASLSALGLSTGDVTGGSSSTGTVTMSGPAPTGGAVVSLSSSDPSVSVPATVTIAEGTTSASFTVTTTPVAAQTAAVVTAAFSGVTQTATITVEPPVLTSVTLNPANPMGGSSSTGTVALSGPAPAGGALVALANSNTSVASAPSSVTVPAGFTNATFTVSTSRVLCPNSATITASWNAVSQAANLAVMPFVNLPPQACSAIGAHRPR